MNDSVESHFNVQLIVYCFQYKLVVVVSQHISLVFQILIKHIRWSKVTSITGIFYFRNKNKCRYFPICSYFSSIKRLIKKDPHTAKQSFKTCVGIKCPLFDLFLNASSISFSCSYDILRTLKMLQVGNIPLKGVTSMLLIMLFMLSMK